MRSVHTYTGSLILFWGVIFVSGGASAQNYLSELVSRDRGAVDQMPPDIREAYYEVRVSERESTPDDVAESYHSLILRAGDEIPVDSRSYLQAYRALFLEIANRHPEAIDVMRDMIRERPEPEAAELRFLLHLEIARAMDDSGGHPLIAGFDPSIEEKQAAHYEIFEQYYPYRHEVMMAHLKLATEAHDAAYADPLRHGRYMDVALEEYTTALQLAVDVRNRPGLAYDERTLLETQYFLDYCSDKIPIVKHRRQHLRDILAEGQHGPMGLQYLAQSWPDRPANSERFHDQSIERPDVARVRQALEQSRRPPERPRMARPAGSTESVEIDAGPFTFSVPPTMTRIPVQGIDSLVGRYADDTLELAFDYGWYSSSLDEIEGATVESAEIDGRKARIVVGKGFKPEFAYWAGVHFPNLVQQRHGTTTLTMTAACRSRSDVDVAKRIFRSIRFKPQN
jgi:hypothetical protein